MTPPRLVSADTAPDDTETADRVARGLRRPSLAPLTVSLLSVAVDVPVFALALWFGAFAAGEGGSFEAGVSAVWALAGAVGAAVLLGWVGGYRAETLSRRWHSPTLAAAAIALAAALGAMRQAAPDAALWILLATAVPIVAAVRFLVSGAVLWARDSGLMERRAVLAGGGRPAADLMRELDSQPGNDIRIVAIFDDRDRKRSEDMVLGVPKLGKFDDLAGFCRRAEVDLIIVTLPLSAEDRLAGLLRQLRVLPLPILLAQLSRDRHFRRRSGACGARLIQALPPSYRPQRRLAKRSFDLVFALLALAVLWPVMLAIAVAVRLDSPGPILFRQRRHGFNHREITVLKFRSMYHHSADPDGRNVVIRGDARVTRVGRILRRSSLDELPQLFNVLGGTLSLVGPRPHAVMAHSSRDRAFEEMVEDYSARHRLPPGITGLAQISGWRGEVRDSEELRQRVARDLDYIENWSLWLDLVILVLTPVSLFRARGAY